MAIYARNIHRGLHRYQRGRGLSAILRGVFRHLIPYLRRGAVQALKSKPVKQAISKAGSGAVLTATEFARDIVNRKNPTEKVKTNLKRVQTDVEEALAQEAGLPKPKKPAAKRKPRVVAKKVKRINPNPKSNSLI